MYSTNVLAKVKRWLVSLENDENSRHKWLDPDEILRKICEIEADEILGAEAADSNNSEGGD